MTTKVTSDVCDATVLLNAATDVASTSGTSIDFTSIPAWAKKITISFSGVSTSSTSMKQVQLGDAGGVETSGYLGSSSDFAAAAAATGTYTSGFVIRSALAADLLNGAITLTLLDADTNLWACAGLLSDSASTSSYLVAGSKALSATLDRVRITTVGGVDTFDAGKINILYE